MRRVEGDPARLAFLHHQLVGVSLSVERTDMQFVKVSNSDHGVGIIGVSPFYIQIGFFSPVPFLVSFVGVLGRLSHQLPLRDTFLAA